MKKVIAYLRVSTDLQDSTRQLELIEKYCSENNYDIVKTISEKISGAKSDRLGLIELLTLTKEDGDIVIISETSRLSREEDYLKLLNNVNSLLESGLDVLFLDGIKSFKGGNKLSLYDIITLSFEAKANSDERKKISERCISGRKSKVRQTCYVGGFMATGYKTTTNPLRVGQSKEFGKSLFVVDEERKIIVETIFDCIANKGLTLKATANLLNSSGIDKTGKKWVITSVKNIVHNPLYTGIYSFAGEKVPIEAIISKELFDLAQLKLKENQLIINKGNKNFNPLKGIIKCPCCKTSIMNKRNTGDLYFNCISKFSQYPELDKCSNTGINASTLLKIVWIETKAFLNKTEFTLKTEEASKSINAEIEILESQINRQEEKINNIDIQIKNIIDLLAETTKEEQTYIKIKYVELVENKTKQTEYLRILNEQLTKIRIKKIDFTSKLELETLDNLTELERNNIYKKYIQKIVYYSVTKYKGFIVITYKNGLEVVLRYLSRKKIEVYEMPQSCTFNPETRQLVSFYNKASNSKEEMYSIPAKSKKELSFEEIDSEYYLNEMQLAI
jgi:site-specific DNA recombinase